MENDKIQWLTPKQVRAQLKVSDSTLRRWANEGQVEYITPISNHRLYNFQSIIKLSNKSNEPNIKDKGNNGKSYCYCRVSSSKQSDDLQRQIKFMQTKFPDHEIITDIGSGLNWKRSGFRKMVSESINGKVKRIVVAYRDRLCRFGFEMLEFIFRECEVELVVLNQNEQHSESSELAEDLLSIIHIFNCRQMGKRRYKTKDSKNSNADGEETKQENSKEETTEKREKSKENKKSK